MTISNTFEFDTKRKSRNTQSPISLRIHDAQGRNVFHSLLYRLRHRSDQSHMMASLVVISLLLAFISGGGKHVNAQVGIPKDGFTAERDYSSSAIDSVDLDSGALIVNIPILSYKQKGSLSDFTLVARYNPCNYAWTEDWINVSSSTNGGWEISAPGIMNNPPTVMDFPGWIFYGTGVQIVRGDALQSGTVQNTYEGFNNQPRFYTQEYVEDSTGSQHLLYLQTTASTSTVRTLDGSGLSLGSGLDVRTGSANVIDARGNTHTGTADYYGDGFEDSIIDASGSNAIVPYSGSSPHLITDQTTRIDHWIDSIGRSIPAPPGGYTNVTPGQYGPGIQPGCSTYQYPSVSGTTAPYKFCYSIVPVQSGFGVPNALEASDSPTFLTSVILPNGTSYTFNYNSWGELGQIGLPDGGNVTYQWATAGNYSGSRRVLQSRTVDPNVPGAGTSYPTRTWTYCFGAISTACTPTSGVNKMIDPDGNETWRYYVVSPIKTVQYQGAASKGVILKTTNTVAFCNYPAVFAWHAISEPRQICQTDTTLSDGEIFTKTTQFDPPQTVSDPLSSDNQDSNGYSWSQIGHAGMGFPTVQTITNLGSTSAGSPLQTTTTHYLWQTNSNYLVSNHPGLPDSATVSDGNGATLSQTTYGYDESVTPQVYYGNLTSTSRWDAGTMVAKTSAAYNSQGMVTDTYDANYNAKVAGEPGNHISITYDTTGLYPSQISNRLSQNSYYSYDAYTGLLLSYVDPNGTSITDNTHKTTWSYDSMGRTTAVSYPDGGGSSYCYTDISGTCGSISASYNAVMTTKLAGTTTLTSSVAYNGLGEVVSQTSPSGATTSVGYDDQGRVQYKSNPYLSSSSPAAYVSYAYDPLSRLAAVCNQDNSSTGTVCVAGSSYQTTSYSGPTTISKDENENAQNTNGYTRTTDSLGRLISVKEPNGTITQYLYDALGNVTCVLQNVLANAQVTTCPTPPSSLHPRAFSYDGLSRLISSYNPEAGFTTYGYDANGNLISKTDARNITSSYYYDGLGRIVQMKVPIVNAPLGTQDPYQSTCYQYDTMSGATGTPNLTGHLVAEWTQSGSTCASSYTPALAITAKVILTYDAMGRPLQSQQCVKSMCTSSPFTQSQTYDLAGDMTSWTDGRGYMTFSQQFDATGRLASLTNSISGNGLPSLLFSAQSYSPAGALQYWNIGGYLNFFRSYDSRLRVQSQSVTH